MKMERGPFTGICIGGPYSGEWATKDYSSWRVTKPAQWNIYVWDLERKAWVWSVDA